MRVVENSFTDRDVVDAFVTVATLVLVGLVANASCGCVSTGRNGPPGIVPDDASATSAQVSELDATPREGRTHRDAEFALIYPPTVPDCYRGQSACIGSDLWYCDDAYQWALFVTCAESCDPCDAESPVDAAGDDA